MHAACEGVAPVVLSNRRRLWCMHMQRSLSDCLMVQHARMYTNFQHLSCKRM
jgi:hypothetical protein